MKTTCIRNERNYSKALLLLLCVALLILFMGCDAVANLSDKRPDYSGQAEAVALSRNEYEAQTNAERTRALKAMDEITWYTDSGELKFSEIDTRMGSVEVENPSAPGSAFGAFCSVTGLKVEAYLPPAENDPTLEEALKLRINDLTGRMHSIGISGARVIINAMYEEGYLVGDAYSADNFAPKITLQARAIVDEISREENKTGKLSGKIDYQAEGGYFEVLCKALEVADGRLYAIMTALAQQKNETASQAQANQQATQDEITAGLPGIYTTVNGGELQINADGSYTLVYGMSFGMGSWGFEDGVLIIGAEPARLEAEGLYVMDIDVPFMQTDAAEKGALTDEENAIYSILDMYNYYQYTQMDVNSWYGDTTDEERVAMARELLDLFHAMGDVRPDMDANSFASLINDSYDYGNRALTVWQAACAIAGVDPTPYDGVFAKVNS